MGRGDLPSVRALPRVFLPGYVLSEEPIELPGEELDKLRKVLRLSTGALLAVLPGDGQAIVARLEGKVAIPLHVESLQTEPALTLTLAQALPKPEKLEEVVRMGTEMGVARFIVFPSERSVVRWDAAKLQDRLRRMRIIAREAAEVATRARLPLIESVGSLDELLNKESEAIVLSEVEGVRPTLVDRLAGRESATLVIGPEGGWAPREVEKIGERAVTLGPRVMRVDTAAAAACALALLRDGR